MTSKHASVDRVLRLSHCEELEARLWPAATAWALDFAQSSQQAILLSARLAGGVLSLGRFQRASDTLNSEGIESAPVRRLASGRTCALGEGIVAVALAVPHRDWLSEDRELPLPLAKTLNRGVRGILAGLGRLGVSASYFGRDFVSVDSGQAGLLSFEASESGATVIECLLATSTHWWPPENFLKKALPNHSRGFPPPTIIPTLDSLPTQKLAIELARGYRDRSDWNLRAIALPWPAPAILELPAPAELPFRSQEHALPLGHFRISLAVSQGKLSDFSLSGEFLADSPGQEKLAQTLKGKRPHPDSFVEALGPILNSESHTILGVPKLEALHEAFEEALRQRPPCGMGDAKEG